MVKKQMQLQKSLPTKQGRGVAKFDDLPDNVKHTEQEETLTRMNFEIPITLRNAFKAKVAMQGKKVKEVFADFMKQYIKNNGD